jgi:predicted phage terminase large subunit-like protein
MSLDDLIEKLQNDGTRQAISEICKKDFLSYLIVVFFLINSTKFTIKDFHRLVIKKLQDIVDCKNEKRNLALCLPVGSGKSLIIEYFITWCFARTIDCTFCYTSNSDRLINKLSKECKDIIENEFWQLLFNHKLKKDDRQRVNFSFEDAKNRTGLTAGTTGGAITGLDAGNPNICGFSGALIIDDPMDAGNSRYEKAREEVVTFYDEKLATRRRTPQTPTILIMQRLHLDDLVGWVEKNEPELWDVCKVPALNENGESFWEERYPKEELKHIQIVNAFKFQAQYQQQPIALGGSVIKSEWFGYYSVNVKYDYKKIIIAADTAIQAKEHSDFSCFLVGGVTQNNHLHILQMAHDKWEYPELKSAALSVYNNWQFDKRTTSASALFIEDKASGQQLIQDFRKVGLPVRPIEVTKDKLTRVEEVLDYIAAGLVELPENRAYGNNNVFLSECEAFSRDMSHKHDDIVDTLVHLINNSIAQREISILEVL